MRSLNKVITSSAIWTTKDILYASKDAYERRRYEAGVKGHKKRKTFKIDKARIPFDFSFGDRYFSSWFLIPI